MTAEEFNKLELVAGRLTIEEITLLVREFQKGHGLDPDGKAGPATQAAIDVLLAPPAAAIPTPMQFRIDRPLSNLPDGRRAVVTSPFRPPSRPTHNGCDFFYPWKPGDKPDFVGDHGCAGRKPDGSPKWVIPYGVSARAAAAGTVQIAGNSPTGYRLWIDHGNGLRTGYFHLLNLIVAVGDHVELATPLGLVGDNPKDGDGRHLHFEISPVAKYAPIDPEPYLT